MSNKYYISRGTVTRKIKTSKSLKVVDISVIW